MLDHSISESPAPLRPSVSAAAAAAAVGLGAAWGAGYSLGYQPTGDYPQQFAAPISALIGGHPVGMFAASPIEGAGGSVPLTAPAALIAKLFGAGSLGSFRMVALYCILACALVGLVLARNAIRRGVPRLAAATALGLFVLTPAVLEAVRFGHPEEALGAALCIAAVLLAGGNRPALAGVALGLAAMNKPWGILAAAPALLAAPGGRVRLGLAAAAIVVGWEGAFALLAPGRFSEMIAWASSPIVAHPYNVWWPLAHLRPEPGVTPTYFAPGLLARHGRELTAVLAPVLAIPLARRPGRSLDGCLALLALVLLARCLLDPGDHIYYHVPFVLALAAWEVRTRGWPVLTLWAAGGLWLVFHTISGVTSPGVQCAVYLTAMLPILAALAPPALGRSWPPLAGRMRWPVRGYRVVG